MTSKFICKIKHSRNFGIALQIMAELKRNCGTLDMIDTENFSPKLHQQQSPLDKNSLLLWLHTLRGMGYIEKINLFPNESRYSLTSKGEDELQYHLSVEKHKMFIQGM